MPKRIVPYLTTGAAVITTAATIFGGIWLFAQPHVDSYIAKKVKDYVHSNEYKILEREVAEEVSREIFLEFLTSKKFSETLDEYLDKANSNNVSLRHLLAIKMGVPKESVADEIADLHVKDKKRLYNVLRFLNREYPELNIWELN